MGGGRGGEGGSRRIQGIIIRRTSKKNKFKRRKEGDIMTSDAALAASSETIHIHIYILFGEYRNTKECTDD